MKRILTSVAVLALMTGAASAERILKHDNINDTFTWVDTDKQMEHPVVMGENGQRPTDCPEGAYFIGQDPKTGSKRVVMNCDNAGELYGLVNPADDQMMESGDPYPDGTFLLTQELWRNLGDDGVKKAAYRGG
jgi:hypothetical protein